MEAPPAPESDRSSQTLLERAGAAAAGVGGIGAERPRLRRAIQIGVTVLVLASIGLFVGTQWGKLPDYEWRFSAGWLAVALVLVTAFYALGAELWRTIVFWLGERIDPWPSREVYGKALVARYVPTSVLALVGRVVLAEREGVSKRACLASVVYELGCSASAAVMIGAYFAMTLPALEDQPARWAILAVVPMVLVALHPRVFHPLANRALAKLGREPLSRALPFGRVLVLLVAYALIWSVLGAGLFAFTAALHPVDAADLPRIGASVAVGFCVALVTFIVPAGLGTRDATIAVALDVVLPGRVAIAIAVAFRILQTAVELLYVGVVTAVAKRRRQARDLDLC